MPNNDESIATQMTLTIREFNPYRSNKQDPSHHPFFAEWLKVARLISDDGPSQYVQTRYIRKFHWQRRPTKDMATSQRDSVPKRYILDPEGPYLYHDVLEYANGDVKSYISYQMPIPDSAYEYVGSATDKPDTGLHDNAITEVTDQWFATQ